MDDYTDCVVCGRSIPNEINDMTVKFCPFCGAELALESVMEYGLEDVEDL